MSKIRKSSSLTSSVCRVCICRRYCGVSLWIDTSEEKLSGAFPLFVQKKKNNSLTCLWGTILTTQVRLLHQSVNYWRDQILIQGRIVLWCWLSVHSSEICTSITTKWTKYVLHTVHKIVYRHIKLSVLHGHINFSRRKADRMRGSDVVHVLLQVCLKLSETWQIDANKISSSTLFL